MPSTGDTLSQKERPLGKMGLPQPHLVLELECERPLAGPARYRLSGIGRVRLGRGAARSADTDGEGSLALRIADGWMSSGHAELRLSGGRWEVADLDSKNGSFLNGVRVRAAPLADGDLLQLGRTFFRFCAEMADGGPAILDAAELQPGPAVLQTFSPAFADVLAQVAALAPAPVPVLLRGASGTGKELVARAIHTLSNRGGPFVAVNCGALPDQLVESELFGYRKGAFSGADQERAGLVRSSDGGTLFLDEIGDLPLLAQAALLRVLQEAEVLPLGATRPLPIDLRVVAATHADLDALVEQGGFRADLLARLDGVTLELLPLRERREDVPLLTAVLLRKLAPERADVTLAPEAAEALLLHEWPLNVRELEHALAGALALSGAGPIELAHLPRAVREARALRREPPRTLNDDEQRHRDEVIQLLKEHHGNLSAVARAVGKGRTQVVRWMERYGLDAGAFRSG